MIKPYERHFLDFTTDHKVEEKINEIIDAVNALTPTPPTPHGTPGVDICPRCKGAECGTSWTCGWSE